MCARAWFQPGPPQRPFCIAFYLLPWFSRCSCLHLSPFTAIGRYILLKLFLSNVLILFSSHLLIAQVSHTFSKTCLFEVLHTLVLVMV
jgi:hypothetical protein